jgi:phosphate/sulfate permease
MMTVQPEWEEEWAISKVKEEMIRNTRKHYTDLTMEIFLGISTAVVLGYFLYEVFLIAGNPTLLLNVDWQTMVKSILIAWIISVIISMAIAIPVGRRWAESVLKKTMEDYSKRALRRRLLAQRYKVERGTNIEMKGDFLYIYDLKPRMEMAGSPLSKQLADIESAAKEVIDSFSLLKYEIINLVVKVEDESQLKDAENWARKAFGKDIDVNVVVSEEKDGLISLDLIAAI